MAERNRAATRLWVVRENITLMSPEELEDADEWHEALLRVRYAETDKMGIVYHANYLVWFEIGRTEFCRVAGFPYRSMEDSGLWILVTDVECRYRKSAHYDDEILVRTTMPELGSRIVKFG